jgi:hypothetical protein
MDMQSQHPLFAFWQLGSAAMLLWGAAAILPILIHLWSRRWHRPMKWAAMTFLLAAQRKHAQRMQVEQWLLLAVRAAILLLFAAALANPQWSGTAQGGRSNTRGPTHTTFVLDASYSMDFRSDGQSRFETAKEMARRRSGRANWAAVTLISRDAARWSSRPRRTAMSARLDKLHDTGRRA